MSPRTHRQFGAFVMLLAAILALYIAINNNLGFGNGEAFHNNLLILLGTKGPVELFGVGILIWLTGKWRGSTRL